METIDLTDPLEGFLNHKNWSPECLKERLSILANENINTWTRKGGNITLNDLLDGCDDVNLNEKIVPKPFHRSLLDETDANNAGRITLENILGTNSFIPKPSETIELSDDEEYEINSGVDKEICDNSENVTLVQVIELSDFSDQNSVDSDQNYDDDELFDEANGKKFCCDDTTTHCQIRNSPSLTNNSHFLVTKDVKILESTRIDTTEASSDKIKDNAPEKGTEKSGSVMEVELVSSNASPSSSNDCNDQESIIESCMQSADTNQSELNSKCSNVESIIPLHLSDGNPKIVANEVETNKTSDTMGISCITEDNVLVSQSIDSKTEQERPRKPNLETNTSQKLVETSALHSPTPSVTRVAEEECLKGPTNTEISLECGTLRLTSENQSTSSNDVLNNSSIMNPDSRQFKELSPQDDMVMGNSSRCDANISDTDESILQKESTFESLEDIRNKLKLQLTSLRTRKKMDIFQNVKQTVVSVDKLQKVFKMPVMNIEEPDKPKTEAKVAKKDFEGVVPIACSVNNQTEQSVDSKEDEDVPNVFNEIRNIIRKTKSNPPSWNDNDTRSKQLLQKTNISNSTTLKSDHHQSETKNITDNNTVSSPFVSNSLDEFLIDSKLNVSYTIPKSGAEEGLRQDYSVDPVISFDKKVKDGGFEKPKEETKYKPKTLAEKRRILEKNKIQEQKRLKKLKIQGALQKRSYVFFRNKKIFLRTKSVGRCMASIESTISNTPIPTNKKPSLLTEFYRKTHPVKYRPGPLCKKHLLQSDYSRWTTELKPLPSVELNIIPQLKKPIHQNLLPIVCQWNGEITDNQMEFALTALVPQTERNQQIFKFDVPYQNHQNTLLVRRKIPDKPIITLFDSKPNHNTQSNPEEEVAQVIDDLIKYVEIREIAPTLIKYDEESTPSDDAIAKVDLPNKIKKKSSRKLSRTNKELLRLSCKVVSMDVKECEPKVHCSKPHCRLGCLCKSLQCETIISVHCQKNMCIFGCTCPKEKNKVLSISEQAKSVTAGSEFLTMDTVTRIEDQAKKNLAKEEKEFTQTIIYANDKTIVVGAGNKTRRAARAPKKYTDFFDEDSFKEISSENKKERKVMIKPCFVALDKWDFSGIIPYCLAHHLYNCHCKGYDTLPTNDHADLALSSKKRSSGDDITEPLYSDSGRLIRKKKRTYKSDPINEKKAPVLPEKTNPENSSDLFEPSHCARTCEIPETYRTPKSVSRSATLMDLANNIREADILKMKLSNKGEVLLESDIFKRYIIEERRKIFEIGQTEQSRKHKRKQQIEVRPDENLNIKATTNKAKRKVNSVFRGEIIVHDTAWLKKICNNEKQPQDSYARILPWNALLKGFLSKSINVYCICDMPLRLLLNVGPKLTSEKIVDIETSGLTILETPLKGKAPWLVSQSENVRDIIKWLLSGTLSSKYKATSLSFLLVETLPSQFEVRGLCTQNENTLNNNNNNKDNVETSGSTLNEDNNKHTISDEITEIKHKNMNNEIKSLFITKGEFRLRELVEDGFDDDMTDNLYMWVGLPEVYKVAKWRVIFLNCDFIYLYFKTIKYSIKYTDLVKLTEMAKEEKLTLLIRNLQIQRCYEHAAFGLYVSPKYKDRIFIGPYFINYDGDDIETLKYMNHSLISSESLNRMKGNPDYKCGHWMYERPYYHTPKNFLKETIDLTNEDTSVIKTSSPEKKPCLPQSPINKSNDEQIITHNGVPVHIKNSKPRAPSEFNRYIITNIPHFGYLGAFQPDHSSVLEVSWPFERKVLQFENADHARDFLQERFNQLLQPVPETFKIQVIVLIHLDLKEHQPINSDFLSGHCICGYFGTYNFKELSDEFCKRELATSKEEITKLFAKRAHEYIRKKIAELAEVTGIAANDKVNYNVNNILDKARKEVKLQEQLRIQQIAEIQSKENVVVANVKKIFEMIKTLPAKERNIESKILNEILQIRPKRVGANEVIEITDDDGRPSGTSEVGIFDQNSSRDYTRGQCKRKKANTAQTRNNQVVKITPLFSKVVIASVNSENQDT